MSDYIDYQQRQGRCSDAVPLLRDLVKALDGTFISTWQSTAGWKKQLDEAREWLRKLEGEV